MGREVIIVDGKEEVVREDTAKSYRGVYWALLSLGLIIAVTVLLFLGGFIKLASDGAVDSDPGVVDRKREAP